MTDNVKPIKTTRDLKQHKRNANRGTGRGKALLKQSLTDVGAWRSIGVDKNGNIGVGNATGDTWRAMAKPEDVIVVQTDGTKLVVVQRTDLDLESADPEVRKKAELAAIYDNRTSQLNLDWEWTILKQGYEGLGLDGMFAPEEIFSANELMAKQATAFLDNIQVPDVTGAGPVPGANLQPSTVPPQPATPGAATQVPAAPTPDDMGTVQPASGVGYAAVSTLPHHPNTYLNKSGDATTPYTVTSFATSLKQRDFVMKALSQARDDNGFDNTTTALIWLCSEYLGEALE